MPQQASSEATDGHRSSRGPVLPLATSCASNSTEDDDGQEISSKQSPLAEFQPHRAPAFDEERRRLDFSRHPLPPVIATSSSMQQSSIASQDQASALRHPPQMIMSATPWPSDCVPFLVHACLQHPADSERGNDEQSNPRAQACPSPSAGCAIVLAQSCVSGRMRSTCMT